MSQEGKTDNIDFVMAKEVKSGTVVDNMIHNVPQEEKVLAAISYLPLLFLVPLFLTKKSKFTTFHAKQGLVLFVAEIAAYFMGIILLVVPVIGWLITFVVWLALLIFLITGLFNGLSGRYFKMPVLARYVDLLNF